MKAPLFVAALVATALCGQSTRVEGPTPHPVLLGSRARVLLVVEGAGDAATLGPLPSVDGLVATAGPARPYGEATGATPPGVAFELHFEPLREGSFVVATPAVETPTGAIRSPEVRFDVVKDAVGPQRAFVETAFEGGRTRFVVGEAARVVVRFGIDAEAARSEALPVFAFRVDMPFGLLLPWEEGFGGFEPARDLRRAREAAAPGGPTLNLGGRAVAVVPEDDRVVDGRVYKTFRYETEFYAAKDGEIETAPTLLTWTYATRYRNDVFGGRTPVDRREAFAYGPPLRATVVAAPNGGRPKAFGGIVGAPAIDVAARPSAIAKGGVVRFAVRFRYEGRAPSRFERPAFDGGTDFHVFDAEEIVDGAARVAVYSLEHRGGEGATAVIPSLILTTFDPERGSYRAFRTPPVPIAIGADDATGDVEAAAVEVALSEAEADAASLATRSPVATLEADETGSFARRIAIATGLLSATVVAVRRRRRRTPDPIDEGAARRRAALASMRAPKIDAPSEALPPALAALALALDATHASVVDPALGDRLRDRGYSTEAAGAAAALIEELVAARYGGPEPVRAEARVAALIETLAAETR